MNTLKAVQLLISKIAPAKYRGSLNVCFQLFVTIGILVATLINYIWYFKIAPIWMESVTRKCDCIIVERVKQEEGLEVYKTLKKHQATKMANLINHHSRSLMGGGGGGGRIAGLN